MLQYACSVLCHPPTPRSYISQTSKTKPKELRRRKFFSEYFKFLSEYHSKMKSVYILSFFALVAAVSAQTHENGENIFEIYYIKYRKIYFISDVQLYFLQSFLRNLSFFGNSSPSSITLTGTQIRQATFYGIYAI